MDLNEYGIKHQRNVTDSRSTSNDSFSDKFVQEIETTGERVLFFTDKRVIVAHVGGIGVNQGYVGNDPVSLFDSVFSIGQLFGGLNKISKFKEIPPEKNLQSNLMNFAIPYEEIVKVEIFRKWVYQRRIKIYSGKILEYRLWMPLKYKRYAKALESVLKDKLVVS